MEVLYVLTPVVRTLLCTAPATALVIIDKPADVRERIPFRTQIIVPNSRSAMQNHYGRRTAAEAYDMQC